MNRIVTVLRSGGDFDMSHVHALFRNLQRSLTIPFEFSVLTDCSGAMEEWYIPFRYKWPGWWSKLELFRPFLFNDDDRIVYIDLDTVFVGNINWIFDFSGEFMILRDFNKLRQWATGLMAWEGQPSAIPYTYFLNSPMAHMCSSPGGDQRFLMGCLQEKIDYQYWQDQFPGRVVSYKKHVLLREDSLPPQDSVICFHGQPRPWNVKGVGWIEEARA